MAGKIRTRRRTAIKLGMYNFLFRNGGIAFFETFALSSRAVAFCILCFTFHIYNKRVFVILPSISAVRAILNLIFGIVRRQCNIDAALIYAGGIERVHTEIVFCRHGLSHTLRIPIFRQHC